MVSPTLAKALELLSQNGWYAERSQEFQSAVAGIGRLRDYAAGEPLYHFDDPPNGVFGLVSGALDIALPRSDGLELTAHRANPGYWVGDLALFANQTRLLSLYAAEPSRVVHVPAEPLRRLLCKVPSFFADFYALSYQNMALALRVVADLTTSPSEARVGLRLLLDADTQMHPGDWFHITQATLAPMVALSVPSLRRILHKMEASGLIETNYARIRILDRNRLLRMCHDTTQLQGPAKFADPNMRHEALEAHTDDPHAIT
jgi:CRP/FNR family transcriptional regulator, cyclic AMP receptor protein